MELLSEQSIIERIERGEVFKACVDTGAFVLTIKKYVPAVFTAIHDGHEVQPPVADKMLVTPKDRRFEEDPFTGDIVDTFSISLRVIHSRYYYDLNRPPQYCIYDEAWGKQVWKKPLSIEEQKSIRSHHRSYYRVLSALLGKLEKEFNHCAIYDLHSYNYTRLYGDPPLFNIGTHYINRNRYGPVLHHLVEQLNLIELHDFETRAVFDEVFDGMGYQAEFIHREHSKSLCMPLEIKKIFMDEKSFALNSSVADVLFASMIETLGRNAVYFTNLVTGHQLGMASFLAA